jgi:methionine salvage enolase-phosphatase E1
VPAVYKTVSRQVVDVAANTRVSDVPAQYDSITYQVKVADATSSRRQVLCESNATAAKIIEIKESLKKAGFEPGKMDGVIRADMMSAVNRYQQAKNLPIDGSGSLNIETVKSLGVSPN